MISTQLHKKNHRTPRLRFPEFFDKWELRRLGDFLIQHKEKSIKNNQYPVLTSSQRGIFLQKDYFAGKDIASEDTTGYNVVPRDYFTYRHMSDNLVFKFNINNIVDKGIVSTLYPVFTTKNIDSDFLLYKLNEGIEFKKYAVLQKQGGSRTYMYFSKLQDLHLSVPSISEQKKIVSFVDCVGEWLKNLQTQKENLEEYRKGVMQKIFSQEIRFRDDYGKSFPKWEEKKLGEILKERKEYSTKGKGYPHISLTTQGVVPKSERYNRDFLVGDDEVKGYKITRLNDLCYNPANLKFGVISINKLGAGIFSPIYVTFEIIGQNIDFVGYYLIRDEFINKARRYEQGTVYERMAVSPADFVKVKVAFPSLPEQRKIADFLNSLDKAIEAKQQQITLAENWKKGLMQGLFI